MVPVFDESAREVMRALVAKQEEGVQKRRRLFSRDKGKKM